jgi:hypothetical protein
MSLDKLRNKIQDNYLMLHFYKLPLADAIQGKGIVFPTITVPHPVLNKDDTLWKKYSKKETRETLHFLLRTSLVYGVSITGKAKSVDPDEILNLFADEEYLYFDNWSTKNSWSPLTKATFDRGVLFLGETQVGIFVVEDED